MQDLEQKRKKIENIVKILTIPVIGFFIAPFIFIAIKGLIGLLIAGAISFAVIQLTPVVAVKFANFVLKLMKAEAMRNPIETLQNEYGKRDSALKTASSRIKSAIASRNTFASKLEGFKDKFPKNSDKYNDELKNMDKAIDQAKIKYKNAQEKLNEFEGIIEQASAEWDLAMAAQEAGKAIGMTEGDFMSKLMTTTALDSVQQNLNIAFADLETSSLTFVDTTPKQLPEPTIEADILSSLKQSELAKVSRKK